MHRTPYFQSAFLLLVLIALLHISSIHFSFYWILPWLDLVMHFLGGLWVGLSALWLVYFSGWWHTPGMISWRRALAVSLGGAIVIGVFWEVFEYVFGIALAGDRYLLDTTSDLLLDIVGAFVAAWVVMMTFRARGKTSYV